MTQSGQALPTPRTQGRVAPCPLWLMVDTPCIVTSGTQEALEKTRSLQNTGRIKGDSSEVTLKSNMVNSEVEYFTN